MKIQKKTPEGQMVDDTTDYTQRVITDGAKHFVQALAATLHEGASLSAAVEKAITAMDQETVAFKELAPASDIVVLGMNVSKHVAEANSDKYVKHGVNPEGNFRATLGNGHPFWNDQQTAQAKFFPTIFE